MHITIEDAVFFSPNNGVGVNPEILKYDGETVKQMLATAFQHYKNPYLQDAICGGRGPLAAFMGRPITLGYYLYLLEEIRVTEETKAAKRELTQKRRSEFQGSKASLILRMIERGLPYICAAAECGVTRELTLDHIEPLSKGGSDDLDNLQFLCRTCNSRKGASTLK